MNLEQMQQELKEQVDNQYFSYLGQWVASSPSELVEKAEEIADIKKIHETIAGMEPDPKLTPFLAGLDDPILAVYADYANHKSWADNPVEQVIGQMQWNDEQQGEAEAPIGSRSLDQKQLPSDQQQDAMSLT